MIELRNVSFRYSGSAEEENTEPADNTDNTTGASAQDEKSCLKNISLTIHNGETVVLAGESGCGKTTITRLINGLIPYYYEGDLEGGIFIDGQNTEDLSLYDISKKVGSVFQNPRSQFFNVDTDSELAFCCENQGLPPQLIHDRVDHTISAFKIEKLMHRSIFDLSGGEKQKIACASVSASEPDIFVLDEPSSNLDMAATKDLMDCIAMWKAQGKTIVIAEHRLRYLRNLADRVIYIKEGRIAREFTMKELEAYSASEMESLGLRPVTAEQFQRPDYLHSKPGSDSHIVSGNDVPQSEKQYPPEQSTSPHGSLEDQKILLKDFTFSYRNKIPVLKIGEAIIPHNEVIAVIGYNGAGKSTFARCFCGLEKKCKGTAEMDGQVFRRKDRLKKIFMVMQDVNHQLFTESVKEEILISMEEEDEKRADEILDSLDLLPFAERHPMSLSGGQKQRVAIGCAVASERDTLIFDEPTSGLDLRHMHEVAKSIKWTRSRGKCVLVITHDLELILRCCTWVIQIEHGEITQQYPLDKKGITKVTDFFETPFRQNKAAV